MAILYNSNIKIRFIIQNFSKEDVQEVTKFYDDALSVSEVEVVIKECSKVFIEFDGVNKDSTLIVENVFQEGGEPFLLTPGNTKMLFELENKYSMLIPGSYVIKVTVDGVSYYSMFEIVPRHINDIQLKNLREFVNSQMSQLSYNMESKLQSTNINSEIDHTSIIKKLNAHYRVLIHNYNSILEDPYITIEKKYTKNSRHEKLDRKAIYLNSKGKKYQEFGYRKIKSYNNKHNIIAKSLAMKFLNYLIDIEEKLSYAYKQNKIEESAAKKDSDYKKEYIEKARYLILNSKEVEKRLRSYDQSKNSLDSIKKRKEGIKENIGILKALKVTLSNFVKSSYMRGVDLKYNNNYKVVKLEDHRYRAIIKIYNNIFLNKENISVAFKPSELIYEYFVYLLVVKVFKDSGCKMMDCDFKDIMNLSFVEQIPRGCSAKFSMGEYNVRVYYEKEIMSMESEAIQISDGFYTHAPNRLPDIRVDYLINNIVEKSYIIESKYRRYAYLWSELYNTHTMVQIKNYKDTIKYSRGENIKPINPISKVIVAYPGQEEVEHVITKEWGDFTFLQLKPEEDGEIFGYDVLKQILVEDVLK
ncbi:MAG: hypothetical protein RSA01_02130 [Clostridium sp.]|uniref:hypothetical protein n=1 Tax=Clostridium sp. TaxID=1506 RepID=UPI002FC729CB